MWAEDVAVFGCTFNIYPLLYFRSFGVYASLFFVRLHVSSLLNLKSSFVSTWPFQIQLFGHRSECLSCPTQPMPVSPSPAGPRAPVCVVSAKFQTDATLCRSPGSSLLSTLKWESLHLARSTIIVWFWWHPTGESGSVMFAPFELHYSFPPTKHDLRHSFGHLRWSRDGSLSLCQLAVTFFIFISTNNYKNMVTKKAFCVIFAYESCTCFVSV